MPQEIIDISQEYLDGLARYNKAQTIMNAAFVPLTVQSHIDPFIANFLATAVDSSEQQAITFNDALIAAKTDAKTQADYAAAKIQAVAAQKAADDKAKADLQAAQDAALAQIDSKALPAPSLALSAPPDGPPDPPSAPPPTSAWGNPPRSTPPPKEPSPAKKKRRFLSVVDNLVLKVRHGFGSMLGE